LSLLRVWRILDGSGAFGEAIDAGEEAVADFIPEGFDVIHALVQMAMLMPFLSSHSPVLHPTTAATVTAGYLSITSHLAFHTHLRLNLCCS
jgi:hypothetical protein